MLKLLTKKKTMAINLISHFTRSITEEYINIKIFEIERDIVEPVEFGDHQKPHIVLSVTIVLEDMTSKFLRLKRIT